MMKSHLVGVFALFALLMVAGTGRAQSLQRLAEQSTIIFVGTATGASSEQNAAAVIVNRVLFSFQPRKEDFVAGLIADYFIEIHIVGATEGPHEYVVKASLKRSEGPFPGQ